MGLDSAPRRENNAQISDRTVENLVLLRMLRRVQIREFSLFVGFSFDVFSRADCPGSSWTESKLLFPSSFAATVSLTAFFAPKMKRCILLFVTAFRDWIHRDNDPHATETR